jgi:hypothetical protein
MKVLGPLLQHARTLPDRQRDARPVFDRILKHRLGSTEAAPGIRQTIDLRSVLCPFIDLVEVERVGDQRVSGLFVIWVRHGHSIAALDGLRGPPARADRDHLHPAVRRHSRSAERTGALFRIGRFTHAGALLGCVTLGSFRPAFQDKIFISQMLS